MELHKSTIVQERDFDRGISMIEVNRNLYVGSAYHYENKVKHENGWYIIHACKEPYHQKALGYSGRGAPKNHPEHLIAQGENRLILDLVDANIIDFIPETVINMALQCIKTNLNNGKNVFVHCNEGRTRSPIIAMLYMKKTGHFGDKDFVSAEKEFTTIYPPYQPNSGIRQFALMHWDEY